MSVNDSSESKSGNLRLRQYLSSVTEKRQKKALPSIRREPFEQTALRVSMVVLQSILRRRSTRLKVLLLLLLLTR
jgi:hypothetical protein